MQNRDIWRRFHADGICVMLGSRVKCGLKTRHLIYDIPTFCLLNCAFCGNISHAPVCGRLTLCTWVKRRGNKSKTHGKCPLDVACGWSEWEGRSSEDYCGFTCARECVRALQSGTSAHTPVLKGDMWSCGWDRSGFLGLDVREEAAEWVLWLQLLWARPEDPSERGGKKDAASAPRFALYFTLSGKWQQLLPAVAGPCVSCFTVTAAGSDWHARVEGWRGWRGWVSPTWRNAGVCWVHRGIPWKMTSRFEVM